MLQVILLIGIFFINKSFGQIIHNVPLKHGQFYKFSNPNYPRDIGWDDKTIEWNFQVKKNEKIKVVCEDLRMIQIVQWTPDCPHVYLSAIDETGERKVCGGSIYNFVHKSNGSSLKIKIASSPRGSGLFRCAAMNIAEPTPAEVVRLHPNGRIKKIDISGNAENPLPNLDNLWIFESAPGTRISFQCDYSLTSLEPMCGWNVLTFNNGISDEEFCAAARSTWFSQSNRAKLRLQFDNFGHGDFYCIVQAVTGPFADQVMNVVSEEVDSSEHGVTNGPKKTSCDCGRAYKSGARIINGMETRVNEFPWMVHIFMRKEFNGNVWVSSCGGSIITARHILTAAHCVEINKIVIRPENMEIILARHNRDKSTGKEVAIGAEHIFVRDLYLEKGSDFHDIAVVLTKEKIDFNTPLVGPVCLEKKEFELINRRLIIMGWGMTENGSTSNYLRKSKARVVDPIVCNFREWDLCTLTKPSTTHKGDSGGPLVWLNSDTNRYSQISLVSRRRYEGTEKFAVSTLVSYFYDWIQEIVNSTDPSVQTCHEI